MTDLTQLREQRDAALLANETAALEAETAAISDVAFPGMAVQRPQDLREAWGDRVAWDQYPAGERDRMFGMGSGLAFGAMLGDRSRGQAPLLFEDEQQLAHIRAIGRMLCDTSVNARCVQENLTSYILGTGYHYKVVMQDGVKAEPKLLAAVQQIINGFLRDSHWHEWRREELFRRKRREGEWFLPLYHRGNGRVECRILEPEQIAEPMDPGAIGAPNKLLDRNTSWTFGIATPDDDPETAQGYCVHWRTPEGRDTWKWFDPSHMVHVKRNVDCTIKRGVSDFYVVWEQLIDAYKLLRNTARGHAILSAIAFIREHAPGVNQSQVETMRSSSAFSRYTQPTRTEGDRPRYTHRYDPGTILDTGRDTQYKASPLAEQGVGAATELVENMILRIAGTNWVMPSYMITGASDANYAAALVTEAPFVKYCQRQQTKEKADDTEILWKVLNIAIGGGRLDKFGVTIGDLKALVNIKVEVPIVHSRDRNVETNRRKILHDDGIISSETWAAEEGYDYEKELKEGAKRQESSSPFGGGDQPGQPVEDQPSKGQPQAGHEVTGEKVAVEEMSQRPVAPSKPAEAKPAEPQAKADAPENLATKASLSLNGAQITAAKDVLADVMAGAAAPSVAVELLVAVGLERERAQKMVDDTVDARPAKPMTTQESRLHLASKILWEAYP